MNEKNYTLLCDFYELTMGNGYLLNGKKDQICYFDVFFRRVPDNGGYAIAAGLEQVIEYIKNLHFGKEDIEFLKTDLNLHCKITMFDTIKLHLIAQNPSLRKIRTLHKIF